MVIGRVVLALGVVFAGLGTGIASGFGKGRHWAVGQAGGDTVESAVDSEIARYFLEEYLQGKRSEPRFDGPIDSIVKGVSGRALTNASLKGVVARTSPDFGALLFAHLETQRNQAVKTAFLREYGLARQGRMDLHDAAERFKIVLVPGLFYRSKPETKGDLREVKSVLEAEGIEVVSIPIQEAGTVEENAGIIAAFIRREPATRKRLILVSTSKGGPETLFALGHLIGEEDAGKVALWFSIGGALRGSYLADRWLRWPFRGLAVAVGWLKGFSIDMIASLSVAESALRMERIRMPQHIRIIHFVGVPLSGTVIGEMQGGYRSLLPYGPNDGITLLPDEVLPGAEVITALGLDHWYRDPDIRLKIPALLAAITRTDRKSAPCIPPGD